MKIVQQLDEKASPESIVYEHLKIHLEIVLHIEDERRKNPNQQDTSARQQQQHSRREIYIQWVCKRSFFRSHFASLFSSAS